MIPLDFNSFGHNVYKKLGRGTPLPTPKFVNPSLPIRRSCGPHTNTPQLLSPHAVTSQFSVYRGFRAHATGSAPESRGRRSASSNTLATPPHADSRYTTASMLHTTTVDTNWMGRPRSIAAVLLESDGHRAILDPGPASTLPVLRQHLAARGIGIADLNAILLTHIHLDHAGATGTLIRENPGLEVYVHKAGMRHMADPSKLLASAERLWPGELGRLFGETLPVPFANLRMLDGGETLALGSRNIEVVYTPGHASHHVSYFDLSDGTAFVGDTAGFHIEGEPFVVPLAPPPDIDIETWNASLDAIASRNLSRLFLTHFGYSKDPAKHIAEYRRNLQRWSALAAKIQRSTPDQNAALEKFVAAASAEIEQHVAGAEAEHYIFNCGLNLTWLGLARYHHKRAEAAAAGANPL
jgi:glyoxylase-like metal-dependent hydrolase (beta-lactamase superfamily II)